jgi:hypothetical protein
MSQKRKYFIKTGDVFGRLTVIGEAAPQNGARRVLCRCSCGKEKIVYISNLVRGKTRSCGCAAHEATSKRFKKHGLAWDENGKMRPLYGVWLAMKRRCYNKNDKSYTRYGGRGIRVCDQWRNNFLPFYDWAMKNGYKPGLTIERINNSGNYSPENCTWADRTTQARNRRTNHILHYEGKDYTLAEISQLCGLKYSTILSRLLRGWSIKDAIEKPLDKRGGHNCLNSNR